MTRGLSGLYQDGFRKHWDLPAFTDHGGGGTLTYGRAAERIQRIQAVLQAAGVRRGDKVALLAKNSTNWALVYLATVTSGAVIVPILPDFHEDDVAHVINHSEAAVLFASTELYDAIDPDRVPGLEAVFVLEDMRLVRHRRQGLPERVEKARKQGAPAARERFSLPETRDDDLAAIVYTSGTTGFSKGVMLPHRSLVVNVQFAQRSIDLRTGNRILSFLPLAHAFGCAFEFLFPVSLGCHITFLGKIPSPRVVLDAFREVRPHLILSVPLVIERIYHKKIRALLDRRAVRLLMKAPFIRERLYRKIRRSLVGAFGGQFIEIVIGGAAFSPEVGSFLRRIRFPYTVGYGMTECGPLISYSGWKEYREGSVGRLIDALELRIDSPDPARTPGEILVRGPNVLTGYYKNKQATAEALDASGWLRTGDLGVTDADGFLYIKGRVKSLILGPSGQNIYPEELEAKLNALPFVQESVVVRREGRLVALVYPDRELADTRRIGEAQLREVMEENRKKLNARLPAYCLVGSVDLHPEEFEKTATRKIKRFLYA
jgi:long-chain acyl-CoA synthetase